MPESQIALIFRWLMPLWLLGWFAFPLSRRLFPFLPDRGLATGRLLLLLGATLLGYWGASLHLLPFGFASIALAVGAIVAAIGWKATDTRLAARDSWRALLVSDAIFLLCFGFFLWVRLRNPSLSDLEKPMDAMLLSGASRAQFLPFAHPWLSGESFTNYYYFGPLLGGTLAKLFATPTWFSYNLIQPLFCAFFLSILWSLGAALTRSIGYGVLVMLLVGLGGHLEPLRQLRSGATLSTLDWWKTSRVVENTINEYPAFTLFIGDLHAHFYALSLAALHFTLCFGVLQTDNKRLRSALIVVSGAILGAFAITNTWDTPLYGLLWLSSLFIASKKAAFTATEVKAVIGGVIGAALIALPYFRLFKSQVSGVQFELWMPPFGSFLLFWGIWLLLGLAAFLWRLRKEQNDNIFPLVLLGIGLVALVVPSLFYIRGAFGDGDYRHMDTVFKFWLQAWLLLGLAVSSEIFWRIKQTRFAPLFLLGVLPVLALMALAPYSVARTRTVTYGTSELSLNGMKFLPQADQQAISWLHANAQPGDVVLEGVKWENNSIASEWDPNFGRVAALTGLPTIIGWNGHVNAWGGDYGDILQRGSDVANYYKQPQIYEVALKKYQPQWVYYGASERTLTPTFELNFSRQTFMGEDGSQTLVFRRAAS